MFKIFIFLFFCSIFFSPNVGAKKSLNKGYQIAKKIDKHHEGYAGETATTNLLIIDSKNNKLSRSMKTITKEIKDGGYKSLITFITPKDVKGTKLLTWAHEKGDDDIWLYLPALRRVKRISGSAQTGSFMGSEFAYEDIVQKDFEKFTYKFIKDDMLGKRAVWVIDAIPKDKSSAYKKTRSWIDKKYLRGLKTIYYNRRGEHFKTATTSDFKKYKKWWRPHKITMNNHMTKKKSIFSWNKLKVGVKLPDSKFSKSSLEDDF